MLGFIGLKDFSKCSYNLRDCLATEGLKSKHIEIDPRDFWPWNCYLTVF